METIKAMKRVSLTVLVLTMVIGCASAPPPSPVLTGPNYEDARAALDEARVVVEEARAAGVLWPQTDELMLQAEATLEAGEYKKTISLADRARRQAEEALRRRDMEIQESMAAPTSDSYVVERGDNLWDISAKGAIYADPLMWPLIYKANRDQIKDADLIYPNQVLTIPRGNSAMDVDAVVDYARNRGAWALGVVEESDRAYLAR